MIQMQNSENGATALCMILGYYKHFVPIEEMREICISSRNGSSPDQIAAAAKHYGLNASIQTLSADQLKECTFPVMIRWKRRYYALIKSIRGNIVTVIDPASGIYKIEMQNLEKLFTGTVIRFTPDSSFKTGGNRQSLFSLITQRLKPVSRSMVILLVFTAICVGLNLLMVSLNKSILDNFLGHPGPDLNRSSSILLVIYLFLMMLYTLFGMLQTRLVNRTSRRASAESGIRVFKKILHQPMRFFEQYSAWDLLSRLDTNVTLDHSLLQSFVPRMIDAVMSVIYIVYLFFQNALIAACCTAVVIISFMINIRVQGKNDIASRSMYTSGNIVNASLLNGLNMIDTIKSTGTERAFYRIWRQSQMNYNHARKSQIRYFVLSTTITTFSGNILQALQLFMGAYFVTHGLFTLGGMSMFQGILGSMINSLNNCITTSNQLQTMKTGIERMNDITHRESREPVPLHADASSSRLKGQISAKDICFRYNAGDELALDHVNIHVAPGQMVAIVGSTGCGKSTLLKILANLYEAESGEVLYDGKRRSDIPDVVFHSSICTVDQETVMFEDSIYNNIRMWDSTIENYEIILAARDAQIHNRIVKEKKDYGTLVQENGHNFSGGELQRFELARALAHEPTLLLLDEFTSALDAITEENAMKALRAKGTTCVIVAHRLSTIVDCDCIYVMDQGRIVQKGTHAQLYQEEGLYKKLVG
mgnify:FL=1